MVKEKTKLVFKLYFPKNLLKKKMKTKVEGPKPMMGSKYMNPNKEIKPARILKNACLLGKNGAGEVSPKSFVRKLLTVMSPARTTRKREASRGKSPPSGERKDPMG